MNRLRLVGWVFAMFLVAAVSSFAQQLYITNEGNATVELWNINTGVLSTIYTIGVGKEYNPDDLIINSQGQLIYSVPNAGTVSMYYPATGENTVLATGISGARDLIIEPSGQTMLISQYSPAQLWRYNFSTKTTTLFVSKKSVKLGTCDGVAYDNYGNLYVVADHNTIVQVNPTTGAIIATLTIEAHSGVNGADGLTYDSYTGELWATHDGKNLGTGLLEIPVSPTGFTPAGYTFIPLPGIGNVDGIKSDGLGNLYIGAIFNALEYNIPSKVITHSIVVKGADGVSLVPGTYGSKKQDLQ
jgi:WD40 repeat protein